MKPDFEYTWNGRKPPFPRWLLLTLIACILTGAGLMGWVWWTLR